MRAKGIVPGLATLLVAVAAAAQSVSVTIRGTVADEQQAMLPGTTVTVESVRTGVTWSTVTDDHGRFTVTGLDPGEYQLHFSRAGFQPSLTTSFAVGVAQQVEINKILHLQGLAEQVEVEAGVPLVQPGRSTLGRTFPTSEIDALPITGRDLSDLARIVTLTPGVLTDSAAGVIGGGSTGFAFAGGTGRNNLILVDGLDLNDKLNAVIRGGLPLDAISEFIVVTAGMTAEYGQASGAVVNMVTRSGTNQHQGRLVYLRRDDHLNATPAAAQLVKPPLEKTKLEQSVTAGMLGGPLRRNRMFYFGTGEYLGAQSEFIVTSPKVQDFLAGDPTHLPVSTRSIKGFARVDVAFNSANRLTAKYRGENDPIRGVLTEPKGTRERQRDFNRHENDVALLDSWAFGPSAFNEVRLQLSNHYVEWDSDRFCATCASITRPSILLGKAFNNPQERTEKRFQLADAVSWATRLIGEHLFKAGFDLSWVDEHSYFPSNFDGSWNFSSDLPDTYPTMYTVTSGNPLVLLHSALSSTFLQDQWHPRQFLTLNLGVRWDYERGVGVDDDTNNVAPRIGVAFDPWNSGRGGIRGSYGRYYDKFGLAILRDVVLAKQTAQRQVNNPGYPDPCGFNPNRRGGCELPPNDTVRSHMETPYTDEMSIGVEHAVGSMAALGVDVVGAWGSKIPEGRDLNYPDLDSPLSPKPRPNPAFQMIQTSETRGHSWYRGLQVGLQARPTGRWSTSIAYTLSKSESDTDADNFRFMPQDQRDFDAERGPTANDSRHRVSGSLRVALPRAFAVAALITARSALPYNVTIGTDANQDGIRATDREAGDGRNSARGAAFWQADVRFSKRLSIGAMRFELLAESFNITNRSNWTDFDGVQTSTTYKLPRGSAPPREVQLGVRVEF